jgi:DNA-binding GntR family transcriptional regulator
MEGLLQMVPRKGIMVSFPDAEDMREIYEIMQGLEGQAVRLTLKRLDGDGLEALQTAISLQQDALTAGDRIAWAEADRRFHAALIEAAGNRRLRELVGLFRDQLNQTRVATLYLRGIESLQESTSEHRELVEALRARELDRALRIHNRHRERTISELPAIVQHSVRMMMQARIGAART